MTFLKQHRRWAWCVAASVGLATAPTMAAEYGYRYTFEDQDLEDTVVEPLVDAPSASDLTGPEAPVMAPQIDISAMAPPITSGVCNCCNSTCCTKAKREAATAAMKSAYAGVFYNNNFSYLNDPCYDGPSFLGDRLKGLCCDRLDVGGQIRVRYHNEDSHRGLGLTGRDDNFWLTRLRLFANWRLSENFRVYGEFLYADSGGETFPNRPIEENRGEAQNLFIDATLLDGLVLRAGRQELLYGAQRLISPLDWANTRRTFDGVKLMHKGENWDVDYFYTNPVERTTENEDKWDSTNIDAHFWGAYGSGLQTQYGKLDAYGLALNNRGGADDFDFYTVGSRLYGESDGGMLYEFEGGFQFGENQPGFGDHNAGFVTAGLGRKLNICTHCGPWKPTVWMWYDWASGGDEVPAARGDDSFDDLFPLAHKYLGFMDLYGRRNINDVNAQFITPLMGDKVSLLLWYHYFFLDQKTTPYNVNQQPFNPNNRAGDRELGHELDVLFSIAINPRNSALVGYSFFDSGAYYSTTPGTTDFEDAQFFYFQYEMNF